MAPGARGAPAAARLPEPIPLARQVWPEGTPPLVSVCCLTFDHAAFVRDCLDAFLRQETTFPVEVLIHDDASTDGTAAIVREYERRFPWLFRPIYQAENQFSRGIRPNPRFNFPRARGQYLANCEGDDFWFDERQLQTQIEFLERNPEYVLCYHDVTEVDASGRVLGVPEAHLKIRRDYSERELMMGAWCAAPTRCWRNVLGELPEELARVHNVDLFLTVLLGHHGKGKYLGEIRPAAYRQHAGSIWTSLSQHERDLRSFNSRLEIYLWYSRTKPRELAEDFLCEAVLPSAQQLLPAKNPIHARIRRLEVALERLQAADRSWPARLVRFVWRAWDHALRRVGLRARDS